ncbi:MAPEG family protein [Loktanella sp. TSTF-M6]|uniref:MAPEG family protein n=1 Tax=Loktanella gaetbuli TaxID=2881335 RepID=A0ABS8BX15_9RHOB|nr:MAPEG family protein [Loktanella gaetbuli]MCB5200290.1 MAPEG family protein [Loktanella gaetbuli]
MSDIQTILILSGLWVLVLLNAQATWGIVQKGFGAMLGPRDNVGPLSGRAARLDRAKDNTIVAFALFAPAALLNLDATGSALLSAQIFLIARVIYPFIYVAGWPGVRTIVWTAGMLSTAWLYVAAL